MALAMSTMIVIGLGVLSIFGIDHTLGKMGLSLASGFAGVFLGAGIYFSSRRFNRWVEKRNKDIFGDYDD